jgi:hypothetical protein
MMENLINDKVNTLTIDEIGDERKLHFNTLTMKANEENEKKNEVVDDLAVFGAQLTGMCRDCGIPRSKDSRLQNETSTKWHKQH